MSKSIEERGYNNAEVLVSTDWVQHHLKDPGVRVAESNEDPLLYSSNHIPGALSIPWGRAVNQEDGTFKDATELWKIYIDENKLRPDDDVIAYCRIGERSSHTWFVLSYLLGFSKVRNYDGSWTEWGNLVQAPIENPSTEMQDEAAA